MDMGMSVVGCIISKDIEVTWDDDRVEKKTVCPMTKILNE